MWRARALAGPLAAIALAAALPAAAGAAQFTVNSTVDAQDANPADGICAAAAPAAGACTLRAAIQQANGLFGAHTINVTAGTYSPATALPALAVPIAIEGLSGARATVVSGPAGATVLTINSSSVSVRGLTLTGGARGLYVQAGSNVVVDRVSLRDNAHTSPANLFGAGLFVNGTANVLLSRSLVANNTLTSTGGASGAGIYVAPGGTLSAVATTITGNIARSTSGSPGAFGGGVNVGSGAQVALRHVTLSGNSSPSGSAASYGGNLFNSGQLTVADSITASGQASFGPNCYGTIIAQGRNIDSGNGCAFGAGHLVNTDPQLLPLADRGGPTDSMSLATTSPARDAAIACPAGGLDQRGAAAPSGTACDIGAVELSANLGVTVQAAQPGAASGADVTYIVRVANAGPDAAPATVLNVNAGGATPVLADPSTGTCTLQVTCQLGTLARGQEEMITVVARAGVNPIALTATVSSGLPDPATGNNAAQVTTPVTSAPAPVPGPASAPPAQTPSANVSTGPTLGGLRLVGRARTKRVVRLRTTLSSPATVATTVERLLPGRRVGASCRAGARAGARCTLVRKVGIVRQRATGGPVVLRIPARMGGKVLVPGRYRVRAVATDAAGRRTAPRVLAIRVTR